MSIKNVFDAISSFDNILTAEQDVRAGGRYDQEELTFWGGYEDNLHEIAERVQTLNFPPDLYLSLIHISEPTRP